MLEEPKAAIGAEYGMTCDGTPTIYAWIKNNRDEYEEVRYYHSPMHKESYRGEKDWLQHQWRLVHKYIYLIPPDGGALQRMGRVANKGTK